MNQTTNDDYKKVCPLLVFDPCGGKERYNANCINARCAWYDCSKERCAILTLARSTAKKTNRK